MRVMAKADDPTTVASAPNLVARTRPPPQCPQISDTTNESHSVHRFSISLVLSFGGNGGAGRLLRKRRAAAKGPPRHRPGAAGSERIAGKSRPASAQLGPCPLRGPMITGSREVHALPWFGESPPAESRPVNSPSAPCSVGMGHGASLLEHSARRFYRHSASQASATQPSSADWAVRHAA
jgi:hypothetical protein